MLFVIIILCTAQFLFNATAVNITKLQNLKGGTVLKPLKDNRNLACVSDLSAFRCDFSEPCQFGPSSDSPWYEMNGYADYPLWQQSVGTPVTSDPPSLAVQLGGAVPFGILTSDPIPCVISGSSLMFKFWVTKNVMLNVCLISRSNRQEIFCNGQLNQKTISYPGSIIVLIPKAIDEPFLIQFMASAAPGVEGFLILDDIYYYGSVCANPACNGNETGNRPHSTHSTKHIVSFSTTTTTTLTSKTTKKVTSTTTKSALLPTSICAAVPCNFEVSNCNFVASNKGTAMWLRDNTRLTNDIVDTMESWWNSLFCKANGCVPDQGYHMSANIGNNNDIAILSSHQFVPSSNRELKFKYFRSIAGNTIKICFETNYIPAVLDLNTVKQCQNAIAPLNWFTAGIWNTATIQIPITATKFHLVAIHDGFVSINGPMAIDDVTVTGC